MSPDSTTTFAGITVPSDDPIFLGIVALHVAIAICCAASGFCAMLAEKGTARHRRFGTLYYAFLAAVFASSSVLAAIRWADDYPLFILGLLSFTAASLGRIAQRRRWRNAMRLHLAAMGASYTLLLIAFYVDNGHNLPGWRSLPPITYWLVPSVIGAALIAFSMLTHPLTRPAK
jgi:uncharacterized membrane protein